MKLNDSMSTNDLVLRTPILYTLTNFPVRHCPGICHPVRNVRTPVPCSLRGRDGIEIGIRRILRRRKTAGLLSHFEAESREAASELTYVASSHGLLDGRGNGRGMLLAVVEDLVITGGSHCIRIFAVRSCAGNLGQGQAFLM